jgi:para-nitrobenzyl esterase
VLLNIWTPADAKADSGLPVIVFMYGGGGTIGSSGMPLYDGENVARHGALFVNFNYRVGALGFMAHPELTHEQGGHSGNYGHLDQTAAHSHIRPHRMPPILSFLLYIAISQRFLCKARHNSLTCRIGPGE